jgi:NADH-quinone oxidoreductase subunit N
VKGNLNEMLDSIRMSLSLFAPELMLAAAILVMVLTGLFRKKNETVFHSLALIAFFLPLLLLLLQWQDHATPVRLFSNMLQRDSFAASLKILFNISGILTVLMTWRTPYVHISQPEGRPHLTEYYALIITIVLGAHLLVMSTNFIMTFLALELVSISSYALTAFSFDKRSAEGSLKYFLFGSVASAIMLYGFSLLYGITGTLDFSSPEFVHRLAQHTSPLLLIAGSMAVAGFLYKVAAAPLHPWAPDVYEAAPMPVIAFFSVVPKLAGVGILAKFIVIINLFGQSSYDWQFIISIVAMLTLTVGNFSALWQKTPKRLMAYSSIAQSGFLLVGIAAFLPQGIQFMVFYACVYLLMNFLIFIYLQYFDFQGVTTIAGFSGAGKLFLWPSVFMLTGFVSLTGLPPTAGFTGKLFIFSALWEAYQLSGKQILLWLMIFGLLNTVVSLFYYLRIPYYSLIKSGDSQIKANNLTFENLLGFILVLLILILFFSPGLLMGWINKINFVP